MPDSKYEKYVCRNAIFPEFFKKPPLVGKETQPPMIFSNGDTPIKGANQFVEMKWVWEEFTLGGDELTPLHSHKYDEMFAWVGNNWKEPTDLGAEVEFWLGEGEDREKIEFNTSTLIFVPKGLVHMPIVYKKVHRPILHIVFGINSGAWVGETKEKPNWSSASDAAK